MTAQTSAVSALLLTLALAACSGGDAPDAGAVPADSASAAAATADSAAPAATPSAAASADDGPKTQLPPNELGKFMVLEYHRLGENEGEWIRSLANFRKDLELLYRNGYRPVTMRDMARGHIETAAGTTPVVFTFDDASLGQFYLLPNDEIDPNTMVGSWKSFAERNPGWSGGGVWCVLPAAQHPSNFWGEARDRDVPRAERERRIRTKVQWMVDNGHELCNHTLYHARLDQARDDAQVQEWIGVGEDSIKAYLPADYDLVTFALPLGMWPRNRSLAWAGTYRDGKRYEYDVVLEVSGGPNVSPFDTEWDGRSVNRFIVAPNALERQIERWNANPADRFVSDGDPNTVTVPRRMESRVNRARLGNRQLRVIDDAPAATAPTDSARR